ncbi:MAG: hypothetical protein ACK54H_09135 [Phycisphaerales bacterium]
MNDDGTYDIVDQRDHALPGIGGRGRILCDRFEVVDAMAREVSISAHASLKSFGSFQLIVSPSAITTHLIRSMLIDPAHRGFPWLTTDLWFSDISADESDGSIADIESMLLEHGGMSPTRFHRFDPSDSAASSADFERRFRARVIDGGVRRGADCAVIGLDGHWIDWSRTVIADERLCRSCPNQQRLVLHESQIRACASIVAAGTMSDVEALKILASHVAANHPGLSWYLSRAQAEESR